MGPPIGKSDEERATGYLASSVFAEELDGPQTSGLRSHWMLQNNMATEGPKGEKYRTNEQDSDQIQESEASGSSRLESPLASPTNISNQGRINQDYTRVMRDF